MNDETYSQSSSICEGLILQEKYFLREKIGEGSFGRVFLCTDIANNQEFALKIEETNSKRYSMIIKEIKIMNLLKNEQGFPQIFGYGKTANSSYVVMTLLGKNLSQLQSKCGSRFSLETTLQITLQLIQKIQIFHKYGLIHRDIKPENLIIGKGNNQNIIYLIDFGLSKFFVDKLKNHIPYLDNKGMIGTARYASLNAHKGIEQSRRDDLESLGYSFIYLLKGKLPWQNINKAKDKQDKYIKIKEMKEQIGIEKICEGCPKEFLQYFQYIKQLKFSEEPNYNYLMGIFQNMIANRNLTDKIDWDRFPEYSRIRRNEEQQIQKKGNQNENQNKNKNINAHKSSLVLISDAAQLDLSNKFISQQIIPNSNQIAYFNNSIQQQNISQQNIQKRESFNNASSNFLIIPQANRKEQIQNGSLNCSSKQNNYDYFTEDDSIQDEGVVFNSVLIDKNFNQLNPQVIRNDIRKNSLTVTETNFKFNECYQVLKTDQTNTYQRDYNNYQQQQNNMYYSEIQEYQEIQTKGSQGSQLQKIEQSEELSSYQQLNEDIQDNLNSSPLKMNIFQIKLNDLKSKNQ